MKTMFIFFISIISIGLSAQTVTVTFQGAANKGKAYQVVIDGVSYYSANSVSTNGRHVTTINNLSEGPHKLEVYTTSNRNGYSDGSETRPTTKPVYTKTFQLREDYDMNIAVRANGQVSFTEKPAKKTITASSKTPMTSTAFNQLMQSVRSKRYQSQKITLVKNALSAKANYFTTTQVRQLISLVTSESRRLDLAKLSYSKVTDPDQFSSLYDILKSEASRDALDNYVVEQGPVEGIQSGAIESTQSTPAYGTAMSDAAFSTLMDRVRSYSYQSGRISEIRTALEGSSYFSVPQIRELMTLVTSETDRLSLVKTAYNRVVDRNTYNQLVNLFYQESNRKEFNNFIVSNGGVANNTTIKQAMSDTEFQKVYSKARNHFFQMNTVEDVQAALSSTSNNFSTEQIKSLLQLVSTESTRLELAKLGYARVVDPLNYGGLTELFTNQSNRTELENYIRSKQ